MASIGVDVWTRIPMWDDFHRYEMFVREGLLPPLECPDCEGPLVVRFKESSDNLYLWCAVQDTYSEPGLALRDKVRAAANKALDKPWRR